MKTRFRTIALLCTVFALTTPLIADNLLDVVAEAENTIEQKYPVKTSIAHRLAIRELEEIVFSDKADEEKIAAIRAKYPPVPVQTGTLPTFNPAQLIFRPPLQWSIQSIQIAYDLDSVTNLLFSAESLYQEGNSNSREDSTGSSDATGFNAGAKTQLDLDVGGGIQKPEKNAWNPLNWIKANAGFQWVTSGNAGINYSKTKSSQWNERTQRALSINFEEKARILQDTRITKCHLTFYVLFKNNTDSNLFLNPQAFSVPVYAGGEPLTDALPDTALQSFRIPRNREANLKFRAELNTTSALNLIAYMRSNEPQIRMDRAQSVIASEDGSIRDAVQESIQVETVPFRCRDLELRIRKYNQGKATTVADAMRAVNAVFSPAVFEFNNEGACMSLMSIPLLRSGEKPAEHRLPVIGLNGSLTSSPIPVSSLNRPLSDEGLSVDVWDITDSEMWKNASSPMQAYLLPYLKSSAESGNAQAQYQLGHCYYKSYGVKKDIAETVKWWRLAAEQGFAKAQYDLALCYYEGEGVQQNYTEAVKWYRKAADQGEANAQFNLAWCYYMGKGVAQDYTEAVNWFRKAAEQGNADAQGMLGTSYQYGNGVSQDYGEAVKWFRKAAEQGNAIAQFQLSDCYYNGTGVVKDFSEAVRWSRKAAEQGYAYAQYNLGWCYANGKGVAQDYAEAVKWYRKAAEQGNVDAQRQFGWCYYLGNGVSKDYSEAFKWFRKAADQGDAGAQCQLGVSYMAGDGVVKNPAEGVRWLQKAATQGHDYACLFLGGCYRTGNGVARDYYAAAQYFRIAAEKGLARAQFELGCCYRNGDGVTLDRSEAIKWFRMAANQGDEDARQALRQMLGY